MTSFSLEGKVAIVTGASRGIGEAIAKAFLEQGARVVLASRKMEPSSSAAERRLVAHVGKQEDCVRLVREAVSAFGRVDVLVNNAGTNPYFGPLLDAEDAAWEKTFEVNLKSAFWMSREVARHLTARDAPGSIVNVSSILGIRASPLQGIYGMTKAALVSLTKTLAVELGPSRIRVNAIAPGLVETRLSSALVHDDQISSQWLARTPLGRVAQPADIAGIVVYLASDASSFVTGQTFVLDGGVTAT
ncbi:MAG TPA: glucose 1-dehydrogenase [Myxococcales bacterium]|jgi:NAD(P)-dependent dehydrogenase (short-subunit alcohol dehydrogenase family)|nr:glucose 1-dehydrogenase [Myxococcales bacterium]